MKKILSLFALWCMAIPESMGQTQLPDFRMTDDFGGRAVETPGRFVPTTADFTLEVSGQAGIPVCIRSAAVEYTPTTDATVRFVQKDGKVYVFEDKTYQTCLTPQYTYTTEGENLLRNGSFEEVDEEFSAGRWKASDWDTWDGGTPTWGGDTYYVNVRENENYRSDGTKSIILHSRSRYLCQQLSAGVLQAGETYCLSCDYWTSEGSGNGGIVYQLLLGSALAGNDLLSAEGYATDPNDHSRKTFSTILQMPDQLPEDLYFSFYRAESRVDWLDHVQLVKVRFAETGLSGTDEARYAMGAFAPEGITLPEGTFIDQSSRMVNAAFDDATMIDGAPKGWILDAKVTQSKISTGEKGNGLIPANQGHWQLWHADAALSGRAYQRIEGLPNGKYKLTSDVVVGGFGGNISLFANYGQSPVLPNTAETYAATGMVVDGTLEIGLDLATTGGVTIDFDSFTLQYLGIDAEGYRQVLTLRMEEAKTVLAQPAQGYDTAPLSTAVSNAESLSDDADAESIIAAIAAIDNAMADYRAYVEAREQEQRRLKQFADLIAAAKAERAADTYPAADVLDEAIAQAEAFFKELEADPSLPVTGQRESLNAARETYYNSQYTIAPVSQIVSYVDLSLSNSEKYVLRVGEKPFYPTAIQVRPDKLRGYIGWSEAEVEAAFKRAAEDGFNALSIPVYWSEVEPEKNHFDWRMLDRYLGWCKKYGVRMELLWFSWSSGGRVQYLWNYGGRQQLRTPDYVCSMEGTSEYNMLRTQWEYSLDWRDTELRDRETYVLGRVMEHVALWDANNGNPHTVIGVQLGNEARSHGANTASDAEIIDWYHHVGAAVKQSKYVTWTRLNCVSWETPNRTRANEAKRNSGGTNIDFVGIDIYGTNASKVKGNMDGFLGEQGRNFRMIMEIDAKDANSPIYQMAALAGDKAFDYYNLGPVDGNGLYGENGHTLAERSHIGLVRQRNKLLNLANQDIALKKHGLGLYVYNYAGNTTNQETGIAGIAFKPVAANTQAVAIRHSASEFLLLSTAAGRFSWPAEMEVARAERGYMDENNEWVKEAEIPIEGNTLQMSGTSCVRIVLENVPDEEFLVNPEFNADLAGWIIDYEGTAHPKISATGKPENQPVPYIRAGQPHLQVWGIDATGGISQTVEGLPEGRYEIGVVVCRTENLKAQLFANNDKVEITEDGVCTVQTDVVDGKIRLGVLFEGSNSAVIDVDDFSLTRMGITDGVEVVTEDDAKVASGVYTLQGYKVLDESVPLSDVYSVLKPGIYVIDGKIVRL